MLSRDDLKQLQNILWYYRSFIDTNWINGVDKNHEFDKVDDLTIKIEEEIKIRRTKNGK